MTEAPAFHTTGELAVPGRVIDQVIGQEHAVEVVRLAARQRRALLLVGEPGTGKSMLAAAMAELMPAGNACDVLVHANRQAPTLPRIEEVPAGAGPAAVEAAAARAREDRRGLGFLLSVATAAALVLGALAAVVFTSYALLGGTLAAVLLLALRRRLMSAPAQRGVRLLIDRSQERRAPFVDATGAHAGGLLGDVRHDPFQSGGFETEPHELVEAGAIHRAHGGVLFVDEISSLSMESQQRLLTALQEGRLPITGRHRESSGAMVRTDPVPCDTVLVVAANTEELPSIHPALRSRLRGFGFEVLMADSFARTPANEAALVRFVAQEVRRDGRIPHFDAGATALVIEDAARRGGPGRLTLRLRELGGLVRAAGDLAAAESAAMVSARHVEAARALALSIEEQVAAAPPRREAVVRALRSDGRGRQPQG